MLLSLFALFLYPWDKLLHVGVYSLSLRETRALLRVEQFGEQIVTLNWSIFLLKITLSLLLSLLFVLYLKLLAGSFVLLILLPFTLFVFLDFLHQLLVLH